MKDIQMESRKRRNSGEENKQRKKKTSLTLHSQELSLISTPTATKTLSCGILKKVILKNFMCHEALECALSPQVMLIQGRNGCGKSAILTGIVVALGGSTRATNRGSSIKDLVKYKKNTATVEVHLNNDGINPYKPHEYGSSIIVQRKISSSGTSSYFIKSSNGQTVSTKKQELQNILDLFNIQVDNPVTVLNQDSSRSFLKSSNPKDLFKFFMMATQLQQVQDIYSESNTAIAVSKEIIHSRSESLPQLEKDMEEAKTKYEIISTFGEKQKKVSELRRELAWAEVIALEKDLQNKKTKGQKFQRTIEKFNHELQTIQDKIANERNSFKDREEKFSAIDKELNEQSKKVKEREKEKSAFNQENREILDQKKSHEKEFSRLNRERQSLYDAIHNDQSRENYEQQKKETEEAIINTEKEIQILRDELETSRTHEANVKHTVDCCKQDIQQFTLEEREFTSKCGELERELKQLKGNKDPDMVYGRWVKNVLMTIENDFRRGLFRDKPVGPLGKYVKVKDPKWAHIAENVIGGHIKSFMVSCSQDQKRLTQIFNDNITGGERKPNIIVTKFRDRVHDTSRFETRSIHFNSLWSLLKVDNIVVANTLLDFMQVESILLIPGSDQASQLLMDQRTVPKNCKSAYTLNGDQYYPDPNYRVYSGKGQTPATYIEVSVEERVMDLERNMMSYQTEIRNIQNQLREKRMELQTFTRDQNICKDKQKKISKNLEGLRKKLANLQSVEITPPPDVSALTEELETQEALLKQSQDKLKETIEKSGEVIQKYKEAEANLLKERNKRNELEEKLNALKSQIDNLEETVKFYTNETEKIKKKISIVEGQQKEYNDEVDKKESEVNGKREMAEKLCERVVTARSIPDITRQLLALQENLKKQKELQGDLTEAAKGYQERKRIYMRVKHEIEVHSEVLKKIKEAMKIRQKRYKLFLSFNEVYLKSCFKDALTNRNLDGYMNINYNDATLTIGIRKDIGSSSQSGYQDLSMMSGGERSFATVCFILALWDVIDSPFRILDEFDVFMDCVARKQSMDLMMKAAKDYTQYIFLTPLDIPTTSSKFHVFVMPDPERNG